MWYLALAAETAARGDAAKAAFPPFETWHFPSQLFWLAVTFTTLYLVLSTWILPKLGGVIEKRGDAIANDLDEAARLNEQAVEAEQSLELALAKARNDARETSNKAREEIEAEIAAETRKVEEKLSEKLESAEKRIADTRAEAMANVEGIAADAAKAMASQLGVKVSDADAKSAVGKVLSS